MNECVLLNNNCAVGSVFYSWFEVFSHDYLTNICFFDSNHNQIMSVWGYPTFGDLNVGDICLVDSIEVSF